MFGFAQYILPCSADYQFLLFFISIGAFLSSFAAQDALTEADKKNYSFIQQLSTTFTFYNQEHCKHCHNPPFAFFARKWTTRARVMTRLASKAHTTPWSTVSLQWGTRLGVFLFRNWKSMHPNAMTVMKIPTRSTQECTKTWTCLPPAQTWILVQAGALLLRAGFCIPLNSIKLQKAWMLTTYIWFVCTKSVKCKDFPIRVPVYEG